MGSEQKVTVLAVEPPTIIGMARPDLGWCIKSDPFAVAEGTDNPHPTVGYRLPKAADIGSEKMWTDGLLAPGDHVLPEDFLCTECYREEFFRLHGFDPFWGPEDLRSARKNRRDKKRKGHKDG